MKRQATGDFDRLIGEVLERGKGGKTSHQLAGFGRVLLDFLDDKAARVRILLIDLFVGVADLGGQDGVVFNVQLDGGGEESAAFFGHLVQREL